MWICPHCTDDQGAPMEFSSEKDYKAHMSSHDGKTENLTPPLKTEPVPQPKKDIKLTYRYDGQCPNCGTQVETIPIKSEKKTKLIVIAWCPSCRENRQQKEVSIL